MRYVMQAKDISNDYEQWAEEYGGAFELPLALGSRQIVLTDTKALTHCYTTERAVYTRTENERQFIGQIVRTPSFLNLQSADLQAVRARSSLGRRRDAQAVCFLNHSSLLAYLNFQAEKGTYTGIQ